MYQKHFVILPMVTNVFQCNQWICLHLRKRLLLPGHIPIHCDCDSDENRYRCRTVESPIMTSHQGTQGLDITN